MRYIPFFDNSIQNRLTHDVRKLLEFDGEFVNAAELANRLGAYHDQTIVEQLLEGTSSIDLHANYHWMRQWKLAMHFAMGEGGAINSNSNFYHTLSTQDMQFINLKKRFAVLSHRAKLTIDSEWAYIGLVVSEDKILGATVIGVEEDSAEMRGYIEVIESTNVEDIMSTLSFC